MLCDIANIALERKSHFLDVYQLRSKNNHLGKISRPKHWCAKLRAQQSTPQELEVLKVPIFNLNLLYIYIVDIAVLSWCFFSRNIVRTKLLAGLNKSFSRALPLHLNYDKLSRIFSCTLLICNHMIFLCNLE